MGYGPHVKWNRTLTSTKGINGVKDFMKVTQMGGKIPNSKQVHKLRSKLSFEFIQVTQKWENICCNYITFKNIEKRWHTQEKIVPRNKTNTKRGEKCSEKHKKWHKSRYKHHYWKAVHPSLATNTLTIIGGCADQSLIIKHCQWFQLCVLMLCQPYLMVDRQTDRRLFRTAGAYEPNQDKNDLLLRYHSDVAIVCCISLLIPMIP